MPASPATCAFCGAAAPVWCFPVRRGSGWPACAACGDDVLEDRRRALVRRALLGHRPIVRSLVERDLEDRFAVFDRSRTGDPLPL